MKIVSLVENTSLIDSIGAEHGLSLYIETGKHKILFDMGQTNLFSKNAEKLGVDLSAVDIAVLSHGHYDHGGGLKKFLEINSKAPVYVSREVFVPHYNGKEKYIGLDVSLKNSERLVYNEDVLKIADGLTLYRCNSREKDFELGSFGLNMEVGGKLVPDNFHHEQYLLIEENSKRILISGCSHKGILNIVKWFNPDVLVGGFHFSKLPLDGTLESYAEYLNRFNTTYYTCHCTGTEQYSFMKNVMNRLNYLSSGETVEI